MGIARPLLVDGATRRMSYSVCSVGFSGRSFIQGKSGRPTFNIRQRFKKKKKRRSLYAIFEEM